MMPDETIDAATKDPRPAPVDVKLAGTTAQQLAKLSQLVDSFDKRLRRLEADADVSIGDFDKVREVAKALRAALADGKG